MRSKVKVLALALGVMMVLGVVGAGVAFAQTPTPGTDTGTNTQTDWQSVYLSKVASILGIDQQKLTDAMTQARQDVQNQQIDAAVAAGRISQDYGNWLKQRPATGGPERGDFGLGFDFHHGMGGHIGGFNEENLQATQTHTESARG
ncbi:MAG: hypothetical protein M0Z94_09655 [Dehalococcoidales bacterium]|nr:hypothetical protein [Dehalococcoidales bacterium]